MELINYLAFCFDFLEKKIVLQRSYTSLLSYQQGMRVHALALASLVKAKENQGILPWSEGISHCDFDLCPREPTVANFLFQGLGPLHAFFQEMSVQVFFCFDGGACFRFCVCECLTSALGLSLLCRHLPWLREVSFCLVAGFLFFAF